jgi:hypothetical protein
MMRVGFNAFFLGQQGAGSGQYVSQLLCALTQADPGRNFLLFGRAGQAQSGPWSVHGLRSPFARLSDDLDKLWFEQIAFPSACRRTAVDVSHVPYFASPLRTETPTVVTVHDLIPLLLPAYRGSFGVQLYMRLVAAAARRADQVITDSVCSRNDII